MDPAVPRYRQSLVLSFFFKFFLTVDRELRCPAHHCNALHSSDLNTPPQRRPGRLRGLGDGGVHQAAHPQVGHKYGAE
jgi:hypothetical protein